MTPADLFAAVFPYYVVGAIATPLVLIACYLRKIWVNVKWQTQILQAGLGARPAPPGEGTVTDLRARRRGGR